MIYSYDYGDGWEISVTRMGYLLGQNSLVHLMLGLSALDGRCFLHYKMGSILI